MLLAEFGDAAAMTQRQASARTSRIMPTLNLADGGGAPPTPGGCPYENFQFQKQQFKSVLRP